MLDFLIRFSLIQRVFIALATIFLALLGLKAWLTLPVDAFPDISPTQVKIVLKAPGMTTSEIETQITRIIETELLGIPSQSILRSTTKYAITDITLDFEEGTNIYWARQQVNERLMNVWSALPDNVSGGLAPMSTPLSEMFMFTVENPSLTLQQKRELLDWQIRPALRTVSGVADVNSLGGFTKTYEITPSPLNMKNFGITLLDIENAITQNNFNGGIGRLNKGNDNIVVRTQGQFEKIDDIKQIVIASTQHTTIRLSDVASVSEGHLTRYGAVTRNSEESVQGLVIALKNSNTAQVISNVKEALAEIKHSLPKGTEINVFYDRSDLITTAINTIVNALIQAVILVIILLALFFGNIRAAIIVSISLPLAALSTFILMRYFSISANLMSLGGLVIAIGMLVDSSVVVVENTVNRLAENKYLPKLHTIYRACKEVAIPTVSGTLIIVIVFSPLLTLTGLEGKLFTPVALTIVFAMLTALLLAFTFVPVLASVLLKQSEASEPKLIKSMQYHYQKSLEKALNKPKFLSIIAFIALGISVFIFTQLGKSFMPTLDEGDIIVQLEKSPKITLAGSIAVDQQVEAALLKQIPEVAQIVARTGSDELGLDPMSLNETDVFMELKPQSEWRFNTKQELIEEIRAVLSNYPGMNINFTQPIQMRVSEMLTGTTGDVSIKIFGDDVTTLATLANNMRTLVEQVNGSEDVQTALITGGKYIRLSLKNEVANEYGLTTHALTQILKPQLEGRNISKLNDVNKHTPIVFATSTKNARSNINSIVDLNTLSILTPSNDLLPLNEVAEITMEEEPLLIERENGKRFVAISTNVSNRDVVSFVDELKDLVHSKLPLPSGYTLIFGGEFENQQRAMNNLIFVVPLSLLMIFIILFTTFQSLPLAALILGNIPFSIMGGVTALFISGQYLSIPASVGFIALLGVAVLNGIVMISYFEQTKILIPQLTDRVVSGATRRLRPVLMTATTAMFGLLPLAYATGPGAEIQKPLAIVVIGGLITSTITTLYLLPIYYRMLEKKYG
ncbi:efflux RND transporter permease subunit [Thalassotalea sediminis]|uniref:efflux RND transporter permease subunit n=1 Tax=Thalassotalea sediminis TaxID=1759089 RepID=UPI002572AA0B|nr:CusA/CzcA family heavy metal efflux RND transporter [Thalassotalea sediminis]